MLPRALASAPPSVSAPPSGVLQSGGSCDLTRVNSALPQSSLSELLVQRASCWQSLSHACALAVRVLEGSVRHLSFPSWRLLLPRRQTFPKRREGSNAEWYKKLHVLDGLALLVKRPDLHHFN